jgi:hypothetical protein
MTQPQQESLQLRGANQVNITMAMLLQSTVPFHMKPLAPNHWRLTVPKEHIEAVRRVATLAGDVQSQMASDEGEG